MNDGWTDRLGHFVRLGEDDDDNDAERHAWRTMGNVRTGGRLDGWRERERG